MQNTEKPPVDAGLHSRGQLALPEPNRCSATFQSFLMISRHPAPRADLIEPGTIGKESMTNNTETVKDGVVAGPYNMLQGKTGGTKEGQHHILYVPKRYPMGGCDLSVKRRWRGSIIMYGSSPGLASLVVVIQRISAENLI